jgi:hypothetical protein
MEQHTLCRFMALTVYIGNVIGDGGVVNAYAQAPAQGSPIFIVLDDVFSVLVSGTF